MVAVALVFLFLEIKDERLRQWEVAKSSSTPTICIELVVARSYVGEVVNVLQARKQKEKKNESFIRIPNGVGGNVR